MGLPLKIDIYTCQPQNVEGRALSREEELQIHNGKLSKMSTCVWQLSSTTCDWSAFWSDVGAQYMAGNL